MRPSFIKALSAFVLLISLTAVAQNPPGPPGRPPQTPEARLAGVIEQMGQQQNIATLSRNVATLREVSKADDATKTTANKLADDAKALQANGNNSEARRLLSQAATLLLGKTWGEKEEYIASLGLRISTVVADSSLPLVAELVQAYPARLKSADGLRVRFSLYEPTPAPLGPEAPTGTPPPAKPKPIKELLSMESPTKALIEEPFYVDVGLQGVADGKYSIVAEVLNSNAVVYRFSVPIVIVNNLAARAAAVEQKLAKVTGHDSAKATARYPFQLARAVNGWRRDAPDNVDFVKEIARSEQVANSLAAGKDPLYQAKGDSKRHYWFADAGEIMPYRVFVPKSWDGKKKLPIAVILHGGGLNEDSPFDRAWGDLKGIATKLGEQHNYILVAPLGYRPNGGYGAIYGLTTPDKTGMWPGTTASSADLSVKDAFNVLDIVTREYNVDRSRTYLVGNSMGGGGVWYLASKYPNLFAAASPNASSMDLKDIDFNSLKNVPVIAAVGSLDTDGRKAVQKGGVAKLKELGGDAIYMEMEGGVHGNAWYMALAQAFDFFDKHPAKKQ